MSKSGEDYIQARCIMPQSQSSMAEVSGSASPASEAKSAQTAGTCECQPSRWTAGDPMEGRLAPESFFGSMLKVQSLVFFAAGRFFSSLASMFGARPPTSQNTTGSLAQNRSCYSCEIRGSCHSCGQVTCSANTPAATCCSHGTADGGRQSVLLHHAEPPYDSDQPRYLVGSDVKRCFRAIEKVLDYLWYSAETRGDYDKDAIKAAKAMRYLAERFGVFEKQE